MNNKKPFYLSKTLWANWIAIAVFAYVQFTGHEVDPNVAINILAAVNIILRFITKKELF